MKFIFLFVILCSTNLLAQNKIYDQSIQTLDDRTISMSRFSGSKILIASVSPDRLKKKTLAQLDSLQTANPSVIVIAVPALDFGGSDNTELVAQIKKNNARKIIITTASEVKKENGDRQSGLLQWLTHGTKNSHFDTEVATDNQLYFISESGILYAVLESGAPSSLVDKLLKQEDVKQ